MQLFTEPDAGSAAPVLGAIGPLQFDVLKFRMQSEYGVDLTFTPINAKVCRWPRGTWDPRDFANSMTTRVLQDREGRPVLLFEDPYTVRWVQEKYPDLELLETAE